MRLLATLEGDWRENCTNSLSDTDICWLFSKMQLWTIQNCNSGLKITQNNCIQNYSKNCNSGLKITQDSHVNPWLIHVNIWQKPLQYCKVIRIQLIKINEKKNKMQLWTIQNCSSGLKILVTQINIKPGTQMSYAWILCVCLNIKVI